MTYGSHTGTGTDPPSTDGQSGEESDGRSGVWMESGLSRGEEKRKEGAMGGPSERLPSL